MHATLQFVNKCGQHFADIVACLHHWSDFVGQQGQQVWTACSHCCMLCRKRSMQGWWVCLCNKWTVYTIGLVVWCWTWLHRWFRWDRLWWGCLLFFLN